MSIYHLGKLTHCVDHQKTNHYNEIHFDLIWHLMHMTKVHRFHTPAALKALLFRFFLISEKPIHAYALEYINEEVIMDITLNNEHFTFTISDLKNLMGFMCSDFTYNVTTSFDDFRMNYRAFDLESEEVENEDGSVTKKIKHDYLVYLLTDVLTPLDANKMSIKFKPNLNQLTDEEIAAAEGLAAYIVAQIPTSDFEAVTHSYPHLQSFEEYFDKEQVIAFKPFEQIAPNALYQIIRLTLNEPTADEFKIYGLTDSMKDDLWHLEPHLIFAYGVKHGYIKLSDHPFGLINDTHALFEYDYDGLLGQDEELYTTNEIAAAWKISEWLHLLP
jgi:hypothetical protein